MTLMTLMALVALITLMDTCFGLPWSTLICFDLLGLFQITIERLKCSKAISGCYSLPWCAIVCLGSCWFSCCWLGPPAMQDEQKGPLDFVIRALQALRPVRLPAPPCIPLFLCLILCLLVFIFCLFICFLLLLFVFVLFFI